MYVGTGSHAVELLWVQAQGKKPMQAADWARGVRIADGETVASRRRGLTSGAAARHPPPRHRRTLVAHRTQNNRSTFFVSDTSRRPRKTGKPYRRPQKDPVRVLAFEALRAVDERDAYANLVLPPLLEGPREGRFRRAGRRARHRARVRDAAPPGHVRRDISACVDRPLREVDPPVLDVLSLGAHQLLGTRIPTHAAVSATVELARVVLGDGRAKSANAVLRKIPQHDLDAWLAQVAPPYDDDAEDHLAVVHSHPRWVVSALWDSLGGGRAGIEDLLAADNERPEVTLVARPGRATTDERWPRPPSPARPLVSVRPAAHRGRRARRHPGRA
ncbi:hypothetical protein SGLAM104S_00747 [Streptomyces glaucescens]